MAKTMKFFDKMLTVFLLLQNPDSTNAKPRFMKKTREAVSTTQMVSNAIVSSSAVLAWAVEAHARHATSMRAEQYQLSLAQIHNLSLRMFRFERVADA